MTTTYTNLRAWFEGRRSKKTPYRRMSGFYTSGGFAVQEGSEPDSVEIIDFYEAKRNKGDPDKNDYPDPLVRIFADRLTAWPNRFYRGGAFQMPRLLAWLTFDQLTIRKNKSVRTDAEYIVLPEVTWQRPGPGTPWVQNYKLLNLSVPRNRDSTNQERELNAKIREAAVPVKGGFDVDLQTMQVTSHEPIKHRQWIKEKRREYLKRRRMLENQFDVRAKLGAFDPLVEETTKQRYFAGPEIRAAREHASNLAGLDPENHSDLESLAVAGLMDLSWWYRSGQYAGERLIPLRERFVKKHVEKMRRDLGAVVYS